VNRLGAIHESPLLFQFSHFTYHITPMPYSIISRFKQADITNNGTLLDSVWNDCEEVRLSMFDGEPAPLHLVTTVKTFWTENYLYMGFTGTFDTLHFVRNLPIGERSGKTYRLWVFDDVMECFIAPEAISKKAYREFQVSPDSRWIDISIDGEKRKFDMNWQSHFIARSSVDSEQKVWTAVMQIPWSAFDHKPRHGEIWHCNFYRSTPDMKFLLAWSPVGKPDFHQPEKFGDIVFE